jgi:hypothetical protein
VPERRGVSRPSFLGTVEDVRGSTVTVALDSATLSGLSFIDGEAYRIGQVGSFVKIPIGYVDLFGVISQIGAGAAPARTVESEPFGQRWITVQIVGEGARGGDFVRGISQYPTIADEVHLVTTSDLARIYGRRNEPKYVRIGHLANAESIPALVDLDRLLSRHSAIVGATGCGKSTTVAGLLNSLANNAVFPSARVLLIDIHGEYAAALGTAASAFRITPDVAKAQRELFIPYWALSFDELVQVTFGSLDDQSRGSIAEQVRQMKMASLQTTPRAGLTQDTVTADSPSPFSIHKLWFDLHCLVNSTHTQPGTGQSTATQAFELHANGQIVQPGDPLNVVPPKYKIQNLAGPQADRIYLSASTLNIRRQLETFASRLRDPRYAFLFNPGPWKPALNGVPLQDLDQLLEHWLGGSRPVTILDLSGVPSSILQMVVGAMLRTIYDAMFWARDLSEGARERPLLLVLEEAHAYLGAENAASAAVRRIAKEGRKYGMGLMIVSQRPTELDATVLSQCGTIFAMRLSNASDRGHVAGAVMDSFDGLLESLPMLRVGEAIIVGEAVHLPLRALVTPPPSNRRPDSQDPKVFVPIDAEGNPDGPGGWNRGREPSNYADVLEVWRKQMPRSPKVK